MGGGPGRLPPVAAASPGSSPGKSSALIFGLHAPARGHRRISPTEYTAAETGCRPCGGHAEAPCQRCRTAACGIIVGAGATGLVGPARMASVPLAGRRGPRHVPLPGAGPRLHGVARAVQPLPNLRPDLERLTGIHLHLHGVSPADVAAIPARRDRLMASGCAVQLSRSHGAGAGPPSRWLLVSLPGRIALPPGRVALRPGRVEGVFGCVHAVARVAERVSACLSEAAVSVSASPAAAAKSAKTKAPGRRRTR